MTLENNEYYLEIDDIVNNSEFDENDLTEIYGQKVDFYLKDASSKVYSILDSAFVGIDKKRQALALRYLINNDEDNILALKKAMIEYVRGDLSLGLGMGLYTDKRHYSMEVVNIFKRAGLWIRGKIEYRDEDIE